MSASASPAVSTHRLLTSLEKPTQKSSQVEADLQEKASATFSKPRRGRGERETHEMTLLRRSSRTNSILLWKKRVRTAGRAGLSPPASEKSCAAWAKMRASAPKARAGRRAGSCTHPRGPSRSPTCRTNDQHLFHGGPGPECGGSGRTEGVRRRPCRRCVPARADPGGRRRSICGSASAKLGSGGRGS